MGDYKTSRGCCVCSPDARDAACPAAAACLLGREGSRCQQGPSRRSAPRGAGCATLLSPHVAITLLVQHQLSASCQGTSGVAPSAGRWHSPRPIPCTVLEGGVKSWQSCSGRFP